MDFFLEDDISDMEETNPQNIDGCVGASKTNNQEFSEEEDEHIEIQDLQDINHGDDDNGDDDNGDDDNGDDDNGDDDNNNPKNSNYEIPQSFRGLEVWEEINKKLEDFTLEDMQQLSFKDHQTCIDFYKMYAKCTGFGIRRKCATLSKIDGHPTSQVIWCNRRGFREAKHLLRPDRRRREKPITRCGCNALISFKWDHRYDSWYVKDFVAEHNHNLIPMNQVYFERTFRDVTDADQIYMKSLIDSGVKPSITMRNLARNAGGIRGVGFLAKDLYNTCEKFKKEEIKDGDSETVLAYLLGKTASDPSFFLRWTRHDVTGIEKMFWCDGISQGDYKAFGSVIAFDTTYKVNAYHKPFVVIVGVNHHRKTVPFGVALVANESTDTYIWVLRQLLEAGGNVAPHTVVTDGDKAMAKAIKAVFPNAHHRLCLWHLMRNVKGHTNRKFCNGFMKCVDGARTPTEFEEAWEDLMTAYPKVKDKKWAKDLYSDRSKWAEAFMVGQFYAGMRSTQRCESMNSTFKTVITSKIMLYRFVELYDQVLELIRFEEDKDDYISTHKFPVIGGVLTEIKTQAARTYTRNVYNLFCKELSYESRHIVTKIEEDDTHVDGASVTFWLNDCVVKECRYVVCFNKKLQQMVCCCMKLESIGIPCRHMFACMKHYGMVELPVGVILRRWTIRAKVHLDNKFKQVQLKKTNDQSSANGRFAFLSALSSQLCRMVSTSYDRSMSLKDKLAKMILEVEKEKTFPNKKDIIFEHKFVKKNGRGRPKRMFDEVEPTDLKTYGFDGHDVCEEGHEVDRDIGEEGHDISEQVPDIDGMAHTAHPTVIKRGGFVDLLMQLMPRTYISGDVARATDSYEISIFERMPTIFDWDPNVGY